jgi:hypothetical protein
MRAIAACFSFFAGLGRIFGIATPHSHSAGAVVRQVSEKLVSLGGAAFGRLAQPEGVGALIACLRGQLAGATVTKAVFQYIANISKAPRANEQCRILLSL